jgi:diguanylate cyclase (GGDEF)-like protein
MVRSGPDEAGAWGPEDPSPEHSERRRAEPDKDASSSATYLLERQAILDHTLRDEDHSTLSSILRRHPPEPVALLSLAANEVRDRFVKWLRNANIEIECTASAAEALVMLERRTHALLFTDRLELAGAVRQLPAGSATHVVFVDIDGTVGAREALRGGANDCMPAEAGGEEFWAHLTTARRIASLSSALQLALTDNRILSTIDELTRCGSRRFFEHEFPREIERAVRMRRALCLVMCDIDHFKAVNDTHGHEVGDEVLQEFAIRLTHGLRLGEDWVARIGGEEFAVVLPEVASVEGMQVAERLCERVRATPYATAAGQLRVTGSFGVSGFEPQRGERRTSIRTLVKAADAALYESKRSGRDRVTGFEAR